MQDTKGKVILSLLAGATAGVVAGLLLAPETGDETRKGLKKSASKLSDDLNKLVKDGLDRFSSPRAIGPEAAKQHADRSAADSLLSSLGRSDDSSSSSDADSDYDGTGGDGRHFPGYTSHR